MKTVQPHPEWKILAQEFATAEYGTTVSHAKIKELIGFGRQNRRYYPTVQRWKKAMLNDHSKEIETIWNEGYKLTEPDQYRGRTRRHMKLGTKRIRIGVKVAIIAPIDRMSKEEKPKMLMERQQMGQIVWFLEEALKKSLNPINQSKLSEISDKALDVAD